MEDKSLEVLFFGDNEMSGFSEILHMENEVDPELRIQIVKRIKELVEETKKIPDFPAAEIASLCDLFSQITQSACNEENMEAGMMLDEIDNLIQPWYK